MKKILFAMLFATLLFSCGKNDTPGGGGSSEEGQLTIGLSADNKTNQIASRAGAGNDVSKFIVTIYKDAGSGVAGEVVKKYDKFSDMPTYLSLPIGNYVVEAKSMDLVAAEYEAPYFYGKQRVKIEALTVASTEIMCTLENVIVTVGYTPEFIAQFNSFEVNVGIKNQNDVPYGQNSTLTFNQTETRDGYFLAAPLRVTIVGEQKSGEPYNHAFYIEDSRVKDHHNITLNIKPIGDGTFTITVDKTTNDKDHSVIVPSDDETLGEGGDPDADAVPSIAGKDFNIKNELVISSALNIPGGPMTPCNLPVIVKITAKSAIFKLKITIDSPEINHLIPGLFGSNTFDLANVEPGMQETNLIDLGLYDPADPIKGKTSHSFEITSFMGMLGYDTNGNAIETLSKFHVEVTDYANQVTTETVTIKRVP